MTDDHEMTAIAAAEDAQDNTYETTVLADPGLRRGMPVIINDVDCPESRLVAVIMGWDAKTGVWKARYLSTYPGMTYCTSGGGIGFPTALSAFGMKLEWLDGETFQAVPDGSDCTARYRDGEPRKWQEQVPRPQKSRKMARRLLAEHGPASCRPPQGS